MIFDLNKIERGKPTQLQLNIPQHEMGDPSCPFQVEEGSLAVSIQEHPGGFFMKFEIRAQVQAPCSSCGQPMEFKVDSNGGVDLQLEQPQAHHVILKPGEMDIRFLKDPELDLIRFFDEQVEFELPQFPKHPDEVNCLEKILPELSLDEEKNTESSPFSVLSSMLEEESCEHES